MYEVEYNSIWFAMDAALLYNKRFMNSVEFLVIYHSHVLVVFITDATRKLQAQKRDLLMISRSVLDTFILSLGVSFLCTRSTRPYFILSRCQHQEARSFTSDILKECRNGAI